MGDVGVRDRLVLCYHAVSWDWPTPLAVAPGVLERQLVRLVRLGYAPATFADLMEDRTQRRVFAVTFDDAYRSVVTVAAPLLFRLGIPGTVFVPTAHVGGRVPLSTTGQWVGTQHESELACMGWDELRQLSQRGWEIGSHSHTHRALNVLEARAVMQEAAVSKAEIEGRVGAVCDSFAFPYGMSNSEATDAVAKAGYRWACTLPRCFSPRTPLSWPRVGVYRRDGSARFALKTSRVVIDLRSTRLWATVA